MCILIINIGKFSLILNDKNSIVVNYYNNVLNKILNEERVTNNDYLLYIIIISIINMFSHSLHLINIDVLSMIILNFFDGKKLITLVYNV